MTRIVKVIEVQGMKAYIVRRSAAGPGGSYRWELGARDVGNWVYTVAKAEAGLKRSLKLNPNGDL